METAYKDDFVERFNGTNFKELLKYLEKFPVPEEFSLDTAYRHVSALIDFMLVLEKHSDELKDPVNMESVKKKVNPIAILLDYIILEISNYYTKIHLMKEKGRKFPDLPEYCEVLKNYRNISPAHRDKNHELKTLADYTSNVKILDSIGVPKIVKEFMNFHKELKTNFTILK